MCIIPNSERFFAVEDHDPTNDQVSQEWGFAVQPVNTDYRMNGPYPRMVIVCESPSDTEAEQRLPCAATTGNRIVRGIQTHNPNLGIISRQQLPEHGFYITNMVRYQANCGITARRSSQGRNSINARLELAWQVDEVRQQVVEELRRVHDRHGNVPVLFACGVAPILARAVQDVTSGSFPHTHWLCTWHPSAWWNIHLPLVDASRWHALWESTDSTIRQVIRGASPAVREGTPLL